MVGAKEPRQAAFKMFCIAKRLTLDEGILSLFCHKAASCRLKMQSIQQS